MTEGSRGSNDSLLRAIAEVPDAVPPIVRAPGDIIAERFAIERLAGSGGMGTVYRALDRVTGRPVALKFVTREGPDDERFAQEARVLAELRHPAIVQYIAHGTTLQGQAFLAMEWLDGDDLRDRLAREGLDVAQSMAVVRRVAEGLGAAHARGVVHRDVKPSNVMLVGGDASAAKLLDFGIARFDRTVASSLAPPMTRTGVVLGTVGYMSPEQATADRALDARADVFSLGCLLFECLTGRPAFAGAHVVAVLAKVLREEPLRLRDLRPELPHALDDLLARMLAKDRNHRPRDGSEVARAVAGIEGATGLPPAREGEPPSVALGGGEQRLVSVILADVPGDADALRAVVVRFGGELNVLADGTHLVTLAGRGGSTEQVARAASCAIATIDAFPAARVVLATGRLQTTGRGVVGPVIDRAAMLLSLARRGAVLIDDVTGGLLDTRFEVRSDGGSLLLVGRREELETPRTLLGKATPCVGREKELALLEATFGECVAEPVARAVLVTAPAGVGKSRLRHEAVERVRKQGDVRIFVARGDPVGAGSAFGLVRQIVRHAAGLREGSPRAEQRTVLARHLSAHFDGDRLARISDFLGELIGAPNDPEAATPQWRAARNDPRTMSEWLRRSFEDWLQAQCASHPVLVVVEDLHWGDVPSAGYLGDALRRFSGQPFMVLAFARPEVHDLFPGLWADALQEIRLPGLTRRAGERLVRAALGDHTPAELVARLVDRADGNAFYLEELIRKVAEGQDDTLPETVLAVAHARLASLAREARHALRAASIFGEVFWADGVAALVGSRAHDATAWLEALVAEEVLVRGHGERFPGQVDYAFRHGLLREAAYAMLTDADRETGHRLAGAWLERAGEKDSVVLAEHYENGGDRGLAVPHLVRGAQSALDAHSFTAAVELVERGLRCRAEGRPLGLLRLVRAMVDYHRGAWESCLASAQAAMALLEKASTDWFMAASSVLYAAAALGQPTAAASTAQEILGLPFEPEPTGPYAMAMSTLFGGLIAIGQLDTALRLFDRLDRIDAGRPDVDPVFSILVAHLRTATAVMRLQFGTALRAARVGLETADAMGHRVGRTEARLDLAILMTELGRYDEAEAYAREGFTMAAEAGMTLWQGWAILYVAFAMIRGGKLREAIAQASLALGTLDDASARLTLAEAHLALGEHDAAETYAREVVENAERVLTAPWLGPQATLALAQIELARGHAREALALADRALARRDCFASPALPVVMLTVRAKVLRALGQIEQARGSAREATALVERIASTIDEPELRRSYLNDNLNAQALALARELRDDA